MARTHTVLVPGLDRYGSCREKAVQKGQHGSDAGVIMGLNGIALGLALATVAVASSALSSTIISGDSFSDGRKTGAQGPKTLQWFSNEV